MGLSGRRALGALLVAFAYAPLHRLLDPARTGPAGASTRAAAEAAWTVGLYGTLLVVGAAVLLTMLVRTDAPGHAVERFADLLERPGPGVFAAGVGLAAALLTMSVAVYVHGGFPTSVDEMAQLLHAQALAAGRLTVPVPGDPTAWAIQNGVVTGEGWASIYPPLHTALLALGIAIGAPWLVGPAAVGVATWASALAFDELLGARLGRVAGGLLAVSPFWLLLGGTHLSHATAAASLALVLWAGLRARSGGLGWAAAAGGAAGAAVTARPWVGLVSSATLLGVLWWGARERLTARLGGLVAGGLPFAALLFWWNWSLFGSPLRLGYSAAFGPSHSLGLHVDPWGNSYGGAEALAYTGADLVQLGAHLLETPLPAVALVGAGLLAGMGGPRARPLLAWAVATVVANAFYWHHGVHMGPRMLYEAAPAWVGLYTTAAAHLASEAVPRSTWRRAAGWTVAVSGIGALVVVPGLVASASRPDGSLAEAALPERVEGPALVFVHGSWSSRVVARLGATGMRRDSIETALRRNGICEVDRYARWRRAAPSGRAATPPPLDLELQPGTPPHLRRVRLSPGNEVWTDPDAEPDELCTREALADEQGAVDLEPLVWQAPPLPGRAVVFARDMGPAVNERVRAALADLPALVYVPGDADANRPVVAGYEEAMRRLWQRPGDAAR